MNKGFSLVELIVVIAIMAILVGVAVPVYTGYIAKANKSIDEQYADELERAVNMLVMDIENGITEEWKEYPIPYQVVWDIDGVFAVDSEGNPTKDYYSDFLKALDTLIDITDVEPKSPDYTKKIVIKVLE